MSEVKTQYGKYLVEQGMDPEVVGAQEQKVPTRGEMLEMLHEAILNDPNRKKKYTPDFKLCKEYLAVKAEKDKAERAGDWRKAQELSSQMLSIQLNGTVSNEERQAEIDKTITMPIASIIKERKKYEAIVVECEEKLDNFDISGVQAKVDELTAKCEKDLKANAGKWAVLGQIKDKYYEAVEALQKELITIPMNELALKRYRANEFYLIYDARVKYFVFANKAIIEEEIQRAKRMEVRGSLVDLVEYVEEEK